VLLGGIMMPDKATMWMCGIEDSEYKEKRLDFWNDVYGFDMSCIRQAVQCVANVLLMCC
jgi:protein arginine N-methyltransferase 1